MRITELRPELLNRSLDILAKKSRNEEPSLHANELPLSDGGRWTLMVVKAIFCDDTSAWATMTAFRSYSLYLVDGFMDKKIVNHMHPDVMLRQHSHGRASTKHSPCSIGSLFHHGGRSYLFAYLHFHYIRRDDQKPQNNTRSDYIVVVKTATTIFTTTTTAMTTDQDRSTP
jgi:hypothetical protein